MSLQNLCISWKSFSGARAVRRFYSTHSSNDGLVSGSQVSPSFLFSYCKRKGLVYPNSSIYGGLSGQFDFGPIGSLIKENIKRLWQRDFIEKRLDMVSVDSSVIMHPMVWKQSGHLENFTDKAVRCDHCHSLFRLDHLHRDLCPELHSSTEDNHTDSMKKQIDDLPHCACSKKLAPNWSEPVDFNLLFETNFGPMTPQNKPHLSGRYFLRPETAQGIITNFENVIRTSRKKLPLGIAQIGKAFRNEISPRDFVFRTREFEQMEIEYFCHPQDSASHYKQWIEFCHKWCLAHGLRKDNVRLVEHAPEDLSHYSVACTDIEYLYGSFWGELWGIANRTDFDLKAHLPYTKKGKGFYYVDSERNNERYLPHVVEPSVGIERLFMAFLHSAYREEIVDASKQTKRVVLQLHPLLAPYKVAVCPLLKKEELLGMSKSIFEELSEVFHCDMDSSGKIGAAYRRQDEIGTPLCVTVDWDSVEDRSVTIRERDSMEQVRVPQGDLARLLQRVFQRCSSADQGWVHPSDDHSHHHSLLHFVKEEMKALH